MEWTTRPTTRPDTGSRLENEPDVICPVPSVHRPSAPPLRYRFRLLTFASTLRYAPDERREDGSSGGERQERRSDCKTRGSFRPFLTLSLSVPLIVLPSWPGTGGPKGRASPHESDERNVKRADDV